ncbi:MAG: protein kinase [Myxococcales bacterium]|nr:protein kinase [Myxococcales bacterium]
MGDPNLALARERIGYVLKDRWKLEEVIGVGGMAAVYAARHRNGARAAIKLLHGPLSEDVVVRERFLREAYLANSLEHPGTVHVLDDDADPNYGPFLVMELLEGSSVLDLLDRGVVFDIGGALDIADQTLDVLATAHDKGIVHRDLKPANLFVCRDGVVKVLDFGIARVLESGAARLTRTGVPLGTPAYMAPEQARGLGREADGRADVYALGATLFRILSGRHVHVGRGAEQIAKVATMRAPGLREAAPQLPPMLCAVIDRSLEFELERRYGSAREMQTDVRALQVGDTPPLASMPLPPAGAVPALPPLAPRPRKNTGAGSRPGTELKPTSAGPTPASEPRDAVAALAESLRQRARDEARRPDAFRIEPVEADDEDEEDMPTLVAAPSEMPVGMRPEAYRPVPPKPKIAPKKASPPLPRRAPSPTPQAGIPITGYEATPADLRASTTRGLAAAQAFALVPNVPVPRAVTVPEMEAAPPPPPPVPLPPDDAAPTIGGYVSTSRPLESMAPVPSTPLGPPRYVPPTAVNVAGWNIGPTVAPPAAPVPTSVPQSLPLVPSTPAQSTKRGGIFLVMLLVVLAAIAVGLLVARFL